MAERTDVKSRLRQSIDELVVMQNSHLQEIREGRVGNSRKWLAMRQDVLGDLRHYFASVFSAGVDESFKEELLGRLGLVIELESKLYETVGRQRTVLSDKLTKMRKGKKALGGYRLIPQAQIPRFLSSVG